MESLCFYLMCGDRDKRAIVTLELPSHTILSTRIKEQNKGSLQIYGQPKVHENIIFIVNTKYNNIISKTVFTIVQYFATSNI